MKRLLVALTLTGSLSLGQGPAIAASAKPGASCAKVSARVKVSGSVLVCTKSGKKLIWKKQIVKPVVISWTTHNSRDEILAAATKSFVEWAKVVRSPDASMIYRYSAETPKELLTWLPRATDYLAVRLPAFTRLYQTISISAINNDDFLKFLKESYRDDEIAIVKDEYIKMLRSNAGGWTDYFVILWNLPRMLERNAVGTNAYGLQSVGAHEYFHIFQFNATGCEYWCIGQPQEVPMWLLEGSATFVQWEVGQILGAGPYTEGRQRLIDRWVVDKVTPPLKLSEVILIDYSQDPYGIGMAATEYLVAKIGMEKFLNILTGVKSSSSFAKSFKTQAGISLDQFYEYFETVRAGLDFPRAAA